MKGRCCVIALTKKQTRFVDEYLLDCNATQAAIRSGYSEKTARQIGQRMLSNVDIKNYIDEQLDRIHNEKVADAKEVMIYLTSVLRGESTAEIVVVEGEGEGCSSARKIMKAPDEKEKLRAAELLGKRYGLFKENLKIEGVVPVVINDDMGDEDGD